jgi:hypothetical protein
LAKSEDIPWKRLTAEAIAIVASILLAFWIDAWWEQRVETNLAIEHLQAFEIELIANTERLDAAIQKVNSGLRHLNAAMTILADPDIEHLPESIQSDIGESLWFQENANVMSAYHELVNSKSFGSLQNGALTKSIGNYGLRVESLEGMYVFQGESYLAVVLPALSQHLALSNLGWAKYDDAFGQSDEDNHKDLETQFSVNEDELRSREFLNVLYHWKTTQIDIRDLLIGLQEHVARLRPLLRAEIEDLTR